MNLQDIKILIDYVFNILTISFSTVQLEKLEKTTVEYPLTSEPRTKVQSSISNRIDRRNMCLSGRVHKSMGMKVSSLSSVRSIGIQNILIFFRRIDQILEILFVFGIDVVHWTDSLQYYRPRGSSANRVKRLTCVNAQRGQRDGSDQKRVVGILFVNFRRQW